MIKFRFLVVWNDSDSEWFIYYYKSVEDMIKRRTAFISQLDNVVWEYAFLDKEIPNHVVCEYKGYFCRVGNGIKFVGV